MSLDIATRRGVHEAFEHWAATAPTLVALSTGDGTVTYGALNERANRLGHHLRQQGVGPEAVVGVVLETPVDTVVAVLGVLKAGGGCVVLDPAYCSEQIPAILNDARPGTVVTSKGVRIRLPRFTGSMLYLDGAAADLAAADTSNPVPACVPQNLAILAYNPRSGAALRGTLLTHHALLAAMDQTPPAVAGEVWALSESLAEPRTLVRLLLGLCSGVTTFVWTGRPPDTEAAGEAAEYLRRLDGINPVFIDVPARWLDAFTAPRTPLPALRKIVVYGGQPASDVVAAVSASRPDLDIAETYVISDDGAAVELPLASAAVAGSNARTTGPIPGAQLVVLDDRWSPSAVGVPGAVCLRSPAPVRGYRSQPALTASRFVAAGQFSKLPAYRTGEVGRVAADGSIELLGAGDWVCVRGRTIQIDHIERVLTSAPQVQSAAVAARRVGNEDGLVAYVVTSGGAASVTDLRSFVESELPEYLWPDAYVALDALPRTRAGRVDRHTLPAPDPTLPPAEQEYVPPRNGVESTLATIWAEALSLDRVGTNDDFLDSGGDSLIATEIIAQIWDRFGTEIPMEAFFEQCTINVLVNQYLSHALEAEPRA
ncbi:MAG TPA: AMP-binding protein [Vicinamibacterales bacterium]|nr:AMP-binding protein [Vicinamibacterales bacterium]